MTYFVEGLTKIREGESTVRRIGEYATLTEAVSAAEGVIDEFLRNTFDTEMTAADLFSVYQKYGEVPFIFLDGDRTLNVNGFNHFRHAMFRCGEMCPRPFPSLMSDEEFEAQQQKRNETRRSDRDQWDSRGIRKNQTDGLPESTIEQRYHDVAQRLVATWASEGCAAYIKLIVSDQALSKRYPPEIIDDLRMLYEVNELRMRS